MGSDGLTKYPRPRGDGGGISSYEDSASPEDKVERLRERVVAVKVAADEMVLSYGEIVTEREAMREVIAELVKAARSVVERDRAGHRGLDAALRRYEEGSKR